MLKQFWQTWFPKAENTLTKVTAEGITWTVSPGQEETLEPWGHPAPTEWGEAGLTEVVKKNDQRTITRVALPNGTVFLKACRVHRPRAWLRELVRPPKAKLEFDHNRALAERGVRVPSPVAWGRKSSLFPSTSFLVTRGLENASPFTDILNSSIANKDRFTLAKAYARFLAHIHDAGVCHPDPHPGNFLMESNARFTLLDLHAVTIGPALSREQIVQELVPLNRWFQARCSRTDRLRFWRAYCEARQWLQPSENNTLAKELEEKTEESNRQFWFRRRKRYYGTNREYRKVRWGKYSGHVVQTLDNTTVENLLQKTDALFYSSNTLKDSRTSTVAEITVTTSGGPTTAILKRFNLKSTSLILKNLLRPSPAIRSWVLGHNLRDRWLPTPRPLLVAWRKRLGIPTVAYLLVEKVADARELPAVLQTAQITPKRELLVRLGRLVRAMHDKGVRHRDLKASNILINSQMEPTLIDLVGVTVGGEVPKATQVKNLTRLAASLVAQGTVTRTDLLRGLLGYLDPLPKRSEAWQSWWRAIASGVVEKQAKNHRTGRELT